MDLDAKLSMLLDLAESLGIETRRMPAAGDSGDHPGGALVRLKGREILFLNGEASLADQIDAAAAALTGRKELENRFLPPEIRQALDDASGRA